MSSLQWSSIYRVGKDKLKINIVIVVMTHALTSTQRESFVKKKLLFRYDG